MQPNTDVIARKLGQATVLVHFPTNRIFELNETGTRIWELVCQNRDFASIVLTLVEEFDVDEERAADEAGRLLERLRTEGLLV